VIELRWSRHICRDGRDNSGGIAYGRGGPVSPGAGGGGLHNRLCGCGGPVLPGRGSCGLNDRLCRGGGGPVSPLGGGGGLDDWLCGGGSCLPTGPGGGGDGRGGGGGGKRGNSDDRLHFDGFGLVVSGIDNWGIGGEVGVLLVLTSVKVLRPRCLGC
jgi:hypothetical protein